MCHPDWGTVYDSGTATHNLTLYRAKSGALVFGAGCVQYSWALDDFHDNPTAVGGARANPHSHRVAVDPYGAVKALQQATVNLFSDMGIQPANLQRDLVPATASQDKAAPLSKIVTPSPNAVLAPGVVTIFGHRVGHSGVVSMVEVSTDGGRRRRATGTDQWSHLDRPESTGDDDSERRATDDSVNLESPGRGVTVTYGVARHP